MTTKLKLATVIGTRPEIIKMAKTIQACDRYFDQVLIHTGQNWDYSLNQVFFEDFNLREPDVFMGSVGEHLGETIGNIIAKSYEVFLKEKPDALLILGDTNSALSAISAKRLKIPIFHMEAGNRCFDENLPEEINRKIVDHISDVNLPYTEHARRNLAAEGLKKEFTFVTGSPMTEVLAASESSIRESTVLDTLGVEADNYILVSAHREENIDDEKNFLSLMTAINDIAEEYQMPVIFSTHPRTKDRIDRRGFKLDSRVQMMKPFGFFDYNKLQLDSFCVLSDSGTLAEESAILGFNAVSLRTSTERPEVMDKGSFVIGGITTTDIMQGIELARAMKANGEVALRATDYQDDNVSAKVVKLIQSHTKIVNKFVWRKS
jgi:UDP-N-acetyl-L-fucosamine synthase